MSNNNFCSHADLRIFKTERSYVNTELGDMNISVLEIGTCEDCGEMFSHRHIYPNTHTDSFLHKMIYEQELDKEIEKWRVTNEAF